MKKTILIIYTILMCSLTFSQRTLEWSIGQPQITCGTTTKICYPLMVKINDGTNSLSVSSTNKSYSSLYSSIRFEL